MRRDRTGELVEDEVDVWAPRCEGGWLDRDGDPPRPCPRCRPWLLHRRPPSRAELRAATGRECGSSTRVVVPAQRTA